MKEKDFQTKFGKWLKEKRIETSMWEPETSAYELKVAKTGSLPFSAVVEHQVLGLQNARHGRMYIKLPDIGMQWPFDCFFIKGIPAFVVVLYPSKVFYGIDIDSFVVESSSSDRRSLTEDRAEELSTFSAHI